jgi:hypothetical protein
MDVISPDRCDTMSVADWLIDGARSAPEPHQVLAQCAERLVGCGIPLWRVAVFVRTLHPNIPGRAFVWRTGKEVEVRMADFELFESEEFRNSPVAGVYERGVAIRRRLADQDCPIDFAVLDDLLAEGVTDYLASPLVFTNGAIQVVTFTTRQPGGFTQAQMGGWRPSSPRSPALPRSGRCGARPPICSTPMWVIRPERAFSMVRSGAGMWKRSTRQSGSPTCAASRRPPIACRSRH